MNKLLRNFACVIVYTLVAFIAAEACGGVLATATYQGHTYDVLSRQSWRDAEAEAISLGGHLATIDDQAENNFIWNLIRPFVINPDNSPFGFWIGLNDVAVEGQFTWSDGSGSTFRNWHPGEPNNLGNQDFVLMYAGNGRWDDDNEVLSGQYVGAVAERISTVSVPEPGSAVILCIGFVIFGAITIGRRAAQFRFACREPRGT